MAKRLTISELATKRETAALIGAVESTIEAAKIADRERSGCLVRQNGSIVRKKKRDGVYVSAVRSMMHSTSTKIGSQVPGRCLEVVVRDSIIRTAPGLLVKVVKGPRHVTIGDVATVEILTDMQPSKDTDLMAWLKQRVAASTAE